MASLTCLYKSTLHTHRHRSKCINEAAAKPPQPPNKCSVASFDPRIPPAA